MARLGFDGRSSLTGGLRGELGVLSQSLAQKAGEVLLKMSPGVIRIKSSPTDLVTEADDAAEKAIVNELVKHRPDDSIVAEEGSAASGTSGVEWVIDPLDGTINYVYGIPHWCVSIGVEGAVRLGVVYDPSRDETFHDGSALVPSARTELSDSLIGTGFSYSAEVRAGQAGVVERVLPLVRDIRRGGSCALDLAWVACGRLDAFYEKGVKRWDTSAGSALVEEAGGVVRNYGDLILAAGTPQLADRLAEVVANQ